MELELNAEPRQVTGNELKTLRQKGFIPGIVYGAGQKNISIQVDYQEFRKVFEEAGESTIIKLKIGNEAKNVLIHEVAKDPVSDKFIHIDFLQVRMDKAITAEVGLVFEGEAPAVKELEGVLVKNITEVEVEALPKDLPHELKVDISVLKTFDDNIKIKDLKLPPGVEIKIEPEEVIALVTPPRTEEELEELEEKPEEKVPEEEKAEEVAPSEEAPVFDESTAGKKSTEAEGEGGKSNA
jgi:large subunit ribosomal protein L25